MSQLPESGITTTPHEVGQIKKFIKNATAVLDEYGKQKNKLPLSEFKRFIKIFRHDDNPSLALEQRETELTQEFHQRVNLYADITIVDDYDNDRVIAVLPKLLRSLDVLDPHKHMKVIAAFNGSATNQSSRAQHEVIGEYGQQFITALDSAIDVDKLKEEIKDTSRNIESVCKLCGITSPLKAAYKNSEMDFTGNNSTQDDSGAVDDSGGTLDMVFDDDD